ncbi:MAG: hypothetical protein ACI318_06465 [Bacilli bacterium]
MKKSKIAVLVLSLGLLMGGISSVQTANNNLNFDKSVLKLNEETEDAYKTVLFGTAYNSGKYSGYENSWSTTKDGFTCNIVNANNYNNGWKYIKMGSKSKALVGTITTATAIDKAITSVDIIIDAVTASSINSLKLYVSSTPDFADSNSYGFTVAKGTQNVVIPDGVQGANKYYKIEADCKQGSSNGLITISKITFNISKSNSNPAEEIKKEETKAQLQYSFETTGTVLEKTYVEVTENQVDWSGDYLIGYKVSDTQAYVLNSILSKIDVAQNYVTLPVTNGKIESSTTNDAYKFTISAVSGGYSIKSSSGLYIGNSTTGNALETTSAEASAYVNTISFDTKAVIKSGSTSLQFYSGTSPRFRYYGSTQKPITLFKCVDTNKNVYSFSNMKMNFGAIIKKSVLDDLSAKATITEYGIAVAQKSKIDADSEVTSITEALSASEAKGYVTKKSQTYDPKTLTLTDATGTADTGDYVIFSTNLKYPEGTTKYTDVVDAVAYFVVNGSYVVLKEKSCSVSSLADEYVASEAFSSFTVYAQESLMALGALND